MVSSQKSGGVRKRKYNEVLSPSEASGPYPTVTGNRSLGGYVMMSGKAVAGSMEVLGAGLGGCPGSSCYKHYGR